MLTIYHKKKIVKRQRLYQTPTPEALAFFLLPIRSFVILLQLFFLVFQLKKKYNTFDYYFTVNAFTAWNGNILRFFKKVNKTIFWVWDYYPPIHDDKIIMLMRWLYWQFDKPASLQSDTVFFLNRRLEDLRKDIGVLQKSANYPVVSIGTNPLRKIRKKLLKNISLVFLGVLKKSQGLDLFFDSAEQLLTTNPGITLHVIGGGPDLKYFKTRAKTCPIPVFFHGYIPSDSEVNKIITAAHIGIATYLPEESNVSYYSDPSKIKRYLSLGIPVITTNVFNFSHEIESAKSGFVINYDSGEFVSSVKKIIKDYSLFQKNALLHAKKYNYKVIYKTLFDI